MREERIEGSARSREAQAHTVCNRSPGGFNAAARLGETQAQILAAQAYEQSVGETPRRCQAAAHMIAQTIFELVDALLPASDGAMQRGCHAIEPLLMQTPAGHGDAVAGGLQSFLARSRKLVEQFLPRADDELGRCRRRRRTQIRDEIGDREIRFVADGGDHRHGAGGDCARDGLLVEGPQILERAAATRQNYDLRPLAASKIFERAADRFDRSLALHQRGIQAKMQTRETPLQNLKHVADDGSSGRCNEADPAGQFRERAFAGGLKEPFGGEFPLELFKGKLEGAVALGLDQLDQQLIFAAGLEDVDAAARQDGHSILRFELEVAQRGAEAHAFQLRFAVLEREVAMTAGGDAAAGDLARHPDAGELALEQAADQRVELGYGVGAPLRLPCQGELFHRFHCRAAVRLGYNSVSAVSGGRLRAISLLLRLYSYLFELVVSLIALALGIIGAMQSNQLSLEILPWTGASLTHWLTGLGLIGLVCTLLAMTGWFRFLFPLWALLVVVMLFRGYVFGSYSFGGPEGFKQALWFFLGAIVAFIGSLTVFRKRREIVRKV